MVFIYKKKLKYFSYKKFQFLDYFPIVKKKKKFFIWRTSEL